MPKPTTGHKSRSGFTLVELLVVIAIIGVLIALLLPAVQAAREAARRIDCQNKVKQIALSCHTFHDVNRVMPTGGDHTKPGDLSCCEATVPEFYTWAYHILPYIEQQALYDIGQTNRTTLRTTPVAAYICPSRREARLYRGRTKSDYGSNCGVGTTDGAFIRTRDGTLKLADFTDGTSNVLLMGENRLHRAYMDTAQTDYHSDNEDCFTTGFADDVGRKVNEPPQKDLIDASVQGSLVHGDFGSSHPGGMNAALADGSVRIITYTIDPDVFEDLGLRADGAVVSLD